MKFIIFISLYTAVFDNAIIVIKIFVQLYKIRYFSVIKDVPKFTQEVILHRKHRFIIVNNQ